MAAGQIFRPDTPYKFPADTESGPLWTLAPLTVAGSFGGFRFHAPVLSWSIFQLMDYTNTEVLFPWKFEWYDGNAPRRVRLSCVLRLCSGRFECDVWVCMLIGCGVCCGMLWWVFDRNYDLLSFYVMRLYKMDWDEKIICR